MTTNQKRLQDILGHHWNPIFEEKILSEFIPRADVEEKINYFVNAPVQTVGNSGAEKSFWHDWFRLNLLSHKNK